jgi:hypothetical protein
MDGEDRTGHVYSSLGRRYGLSNSWGLDRWEDGIALPIHLVRHLVSLGRLVHQYRVL